MNLKQNWEVIIDTDIYKEIRRFPRNDRNRIIAVIEDPFFEPYIGDLEKIKGEDDTWRRRIDAYRIFYNVNQREKVVHVFWVERRTSKTY